MAKLNPDTRLLRQADDPTYRRLAQCLREKGVDPATSALAVFFPDGPDDFGIVVGPNGAVFEFELHAGRGDIATATATATISRWDDVTTSWRERPFSSDVAAALAIVDRASDG